MNVLGPSRFPTAAIVACLLLASTATAAQPPTGRLLLQPSQAVYYVDQILRMTVEVELTDCELGGNLQLGGLPEGTWARNEGFAEIAGDSRTQDGRLVTTKRFATDLRLLREGQYSIAPALSGTTAERQRRGMMTMWSHAPFRLVLPPITVTVASVPSPAPSDFCGAVGRFRLTADVSPQAVSPADLVNLRWRLEGYGNLEAFRIPSYDTPASFRSYPPREETREAGRRVAVTQVLVPQSLEATQIPALLLSVFNPEAGRYEQLTAGPFPLTIVPRGAEAPPVAPDPALTPSVASPNVQRASPTAPWTIPAPSMAQPMLVVLGGIALAIVVFSAAAGRSRWLAVLLAVVVVGGAIALHRALQARQQRDVLVLSAAAESRLCPSATARSLATIPAGTSVRVLEQTARWLRVEHAGASGWIPLSEP